MRTLLPYAALFLACLTQACAAAPGAGPILPADTSAPLPRDTTAPIQTEKLEYPLFREIKIAATYRNRTGSVVRVTRCGRSLPDFVLQKQVSGRWVTAYDRDCEMIRIRPAFTVAPGGVYMDTLTLIHDIYTDAWKVEDVPGVYRLVYMLSTQTGESDDPDPPLLRETERVSNQFRITAP